MHRSEAALFDHLVGAGKQRWWHSDAQYLGGLEVDHQLVLSRRLHRQVGGFLAFKDTIDVTGRLAGTGRGNQPRRRLDHRR
jgi:hypothetical protein